LLVGEPYRVDAHGVGDVAAGIRRRVAGRPGDCATQVEYRRIRPRRPGPKGVLSDDVDDLVRQNREVSAFPVVVPPVGDGAVDAALVVDVELGSDQVHERGAVVAKFMNDTFTVLGGSRVAASNRDRRSEVQLVADDRQGRDGAEPDNGSEL